MRVLIVDFNHIAYNLAFGGGRLSSVVDGMVIDTTIPNGALKNIMRWSDFGRNPTAVCFDRACVPRKMYWKLTSGEEITKYKGTRDRMPNAMFDAIGLTENLLRQAGVSCFAKEGYEADDLVFAAIEEAKRDFPGVPIDVVTGDSDLLPLVDSTVSVFFRSRKATWAETRELRKNKYIQVTPSNFQDVVKGLSAYKDFDIPYNLLLLLKLTRGDDSDNVPGMKKSFPPRKVKEILSRMNEEGFGSIRYQRGVVTADNHWGIPDELRRLISFLQKYCSDLVGEAELNHITRVYLGINLNQPYVDIQNKKWLRQSVGIREIRQFRANDLVSSGKRIGVNIPIG